MGIAKFPTTFPRLETARLVLRDLEEGDTEPLFHNFADEAVARYVMAPLTRLEEAQAIFEAFKAEFVQGKSLTWAIVLKEDHTFLGTCSCEVKSSRHAEIGFDLASAYWGQGLMSEALGAVIEYGFEELDLEKMEAHTFLLNSRAIRLLKRLDFQVVGVVQENCLFRRQFWDEVFFALYRE